MKSVEELRTEARRLLDSVKTATDSVRKLDLATEALELAQRAEELARLPVDSEKLRVKVERYRRLLAVRAADEDQLRMFNDLLQDAEQLLEQLSHKR